MGAHVRCNRIERHRGFCAGQDNGRRSARHQAAHGLLDQLAAWRRMTGLDMLDAWKNQGVELTIFGQHRRIAPREQGGIEDAGRQCGPGGDDAHPFTRRCQQAKFVTAGLHDVQEGHGAVACQLGMPEMRRVARHGQRQRTGSDQAVASGQQRWQWRGRAAQDGG